MYAICLWLIAIVMGTACVMFGEDLGNPYVIALLAAVAVAAERGHVQLSSELSESVSLVPILFAAVLFGPSRP